MEYRTFLEHIRELAKKTNVALAQIWKISQTKLSDNFQLGTVCTVQMVN